MLVHRILFDSIFVDRKLLASSPGDTDGHVKETQEAESSILWFYQF